MNLDEKFKQTLGELHVQLMIAQDKIEQLTQEIEDLKKPNEDK